MVDNSTFLINLGTEIKAKRQLLGLSQKQLADHAGVTWRSISNFERGFCEPKLETLHQICTVLSLSIDELLNLPSHPKSLTRHLIEKKLIQQFEMFSDDHLFFLSKCLEMLSRCA